jgi:hypothetical protein
MPRRSISGSYERFEHFMHDLTAAARLEPISFLLSREETYSTVTYFVELITKADR